MNTETGTIYRGPADIEAARERGEPITEVSETVAKLVEAGNRAQRRAAVQRQKQRVKRRVKRR